MRSTRMMSFGTLLVPSLWKPESYSGLTYKSNYQPILSTKFQYKPSTHLLLVSKFNYITPYRRLILVHYGEGQVQW